MAMIRRARTTDAKAIANVSMPYGSQCRSARSYGQKAGGGVFFHSEYVRCRVYHQTVFCCRRILLCIFDPLPKFNWRSPLRPFAPTKKQIPCWAFTNGGQTQWSVRSSILRLDAGSFMAVGFGGGGGFCACVVSSHLFRTSFVEAEAFGEKE